MSLTNTEIVLHGPQKPLSLLIFLWRWDFSLTTPVPTWTAPPPTPATLQGSARDDITRQGHAGEAACQHLPQGLQVLL